MHIIWFPIILVGMLIFMTLQDWFFKRAERKSRKNGTYKTDMSYMRTSGTTSSAASITDSSFFNSSSPMSYDSSCGDSGSSSC